MTDEQKIKLMIEVLQTLKEDAEMALNRKWDKSDEGFEDQITLIDGTLNQVK